MTVFTLQRMLGTRDKVTELLEQSANAARDAARAANRVAHDGGDAESVLASLREARRREKALMVEIREELIRSFVTRLDREDIEAINAALYRIPKTAGKFAARYVLVSGRLRGFDFGARTEILVACTEVVADMVHEMRGALRIAPMQAFQSRLQMLEGEADWLLLEPYGDLYLNEADPVRVMLAKDLFETIEKAIDMCRDVGNVIYSIILKNG